MASLKGTSRPSFPCSRHATGPLFCCCRLCCFSAYPFADLPHMSAICSHCVVMYGALHQFSGFWACSVPFQVATLYGSSHVCGRPPTFWRACPTSTLDGWVRALVKWQLARIVSETPIAQVRGRALHTLGVTLAPKPDVPATLELTWLVVSIFACVCHAPCSFANFCSKVPQRCLDGFVLVAGL